MPRFDAEDLDDVPPTEPPKRTRPAWLVPLIVAAVLLVAVVLVAGVFTARRQVRHEREVVHVARMEAEEAARVRADREVRATLDATTAELARQYRADAAAADRRFKGQRVRVLDADIEQVARTPDGVFVATARPDPGDAGAGRREEVRFVFLFRDAAPALGKVGPGPVKALEGTCRGKTAERPRGAPEADAYIVFDGTVVP